MSDSTKKPQRIQRKRTKGWRMPDGAVYVGRPSRWGNPFQIGALYREPGAWNAPCAPYDGHTPPGRYSDLSLVGDTYDYEIAAVRDRKHAVDLFRAYVTFYDDDWWPRTIQGHLGGRDLACWCPLDQPCHADVLLEIANAGGGE